MVTPGSGTLTIADGVNYTHTGTVFTIGGGQNFVVDTVGAATAEISGQINAGLGDGNVVKNGTGTLTLSNANNGYGGETRINNGTLVIDDVADAGTGSNIGDANPTDNLIIGSASTSATLRFAGTGADSTNRAIEIGAAGGTIEISDAGGNLTLSGAVSGSGALTKSGTGTLTISGTSTFANKTTLSAGTLALSGTGSLGEGELALNGGTTLDVTSSTAAVNNDITGTGGITGNLNVGANGSLAPGTNPGDAATMTVTGTLDLDGALLVDVIGTGTTAGTDFDQVIVTGATVDLTNASIVGTISADNTNGLTVISNTGGADLTGVEMTGIPEGTSILFDAGSGVRATVSYNDTGVDGDDLTITPATAPPALTFNPAATFSLGTGDVVDSDGFVSVDEVTTDTAFQADGFVTATVGDTVNGFTDLGTSDFIVTVQVSNTSLFTGGGQPAIVGEDDGTGDGSSTGNLTFTLAANQFGFADVTIRVQGDASALIAERSFRIDVQEVIASPAFNMGGGDADEEQDESYVATSFGELVQRNRDNADRIRFIDVDTSTGNDNQELKIDTNGDGVLETLTDGAEVNIDLLTNLVIDPVDGTFNGTARFSWVRILPDNSVHPDDNVGDPYIAAIRINEDAPLKGEATLTADQFGGPVTVDNFLTGIQGDDLSFSTNVVTNAGLLGGAPQISFLGSTGSFSFTPSGSGFGTSLVEVTASNAAGSVTQLLFISILEGTQPSSGAPTLSYNSDYFTAQSFLPSSSVGSTSQPESILLGYSSSALGGSVDPAAYGVSSYRSGDFSSGTVLFFKDVSQFQKTLESLASLNGGYYSIQIFDLDLLSDEERFELLGEAAEGEGTTPVASEE